MAVTEARYNPDGYHVGTGWPFDSSFIAWGLRRHAYSEEAARVAMGILDAATFIQGRLPEGPAGTRGNVLTPISTQEVRRKG